MGLLENTSDGYNNTKEALASNVVPTTKQVFTCPTTVLLTGPAPIMMKNWDRLIKEAKNPLCVIMLAVISIRSE